jgi:hypothetical protein
MTCEHAAAIIFGRANLVFCSAEDLSEGGVLLRLPNKFSVRIGESLLIGRTSAFEHEREATVVAARGQSCHCAFKRGQSRAMQA